MKNTLKVILMLMIGTFFFQISITYMANNISDFENIALPPKRIPHYSTQNPLIKVDATSKAHGGHALGTGFKWNHKINKLMSTIFFM